MEKIYKYSEGTIGVVSKNPISINDTFYDGINKLTNEPQEKMVVNIHEQRPERGEYNDESKRRMWAKVDIELVQTL